VIPPSVATAFPQSLRARGQRYHEDGRVQIVSASDESLFALVRGSELYRVELFVADGALDWICSCPYAADAGICKHVWATLLEADASGQLPDAGLEPEDGWDDSSLAAVTAPPGSPPAPANHRAPRSTAWKQEIGRLRQAMSARPPDDDPEPWPADRRLLYLIDLPATLTGNGLVVELATERLKADGTWDRPTQLRLRREQWLQIPDDRDRQIAQMLLGAREEYAYYGAPPTARRFVLPDAAYESTLRLICETGRCRMRRVAGEECSRPLAWDSGAPWEFRLRLVDDARGGWRVDGVLRRDEEEMPLARPVLFLHGGILFTDDLVARFTHGGAFPLVAALRGGAPLAAAAGDVPELLQALYALPHLPPLDLPAALGVDETHPAPVPLLTIRSAGPPGAPGTTLAAELAFDYDGVVVPASRADAALFDRDRRRVLHRDRPAERSAVARLRRAGARDEYDYRAGRKRLVLPPAKLAPAVAALTAEGWRVEADGRLYRQPGASKVEVRSGVDWFELDAAVEFGDQRAPLPRLLAALRRGERTVVLDDGSLGLVPEEWLRRYAPLARAGTETNGALRYGRNQAGLLDAMLAALPEVRTDQLFERMRAELRQLERVAPADAPSGFVGELRPYQREGLGWLHFLRRLGAGGCLADDMGLGKTIQVLALLEARREAGAGPSLVVVPRSLVFNWRQEAGRFAPALRVLDYTGGERRRAALEPGGYDLVLTTYGTLRRDVADLRAVPFDYVVLDEAQAIKNAGTASAKAARLLNGAHRVAMTGTPVENRLAELWSIFEFLNPGMLGAAAVFKAAGAGAAEGDREARALLGRALRPFILRRTKQQVARDLPEKLEQTIYVDLEPAQRQLYDELRDHYRAALLGRIDRVGIGRAKLQILEALLRLRQAACHPGLIDAARADEGGGKLELLRSRLAEATAEGHKVLVFSQFTSFLALLRRRLDADGVTYEYLDGRTRDRQARVERFQGDPACQLFLISLKAGGQGLNLTAADYVFLLDPWWNPAAEAQAIDRAHRIGQSRRVFASRLIARDTVEEKVLELQRTKRELADAIVSGDNGVIGTIGREELELLLG